MAWTELTCRRYERKSDGYSSDVTDMEWAVIAPFLPDRNRSGQPRRVDFRRVCVFRGHPASDSESIRPGIPILSGH